MRLHPARGALISLALAAAACSPAATSTATTATSQSTPMAMNEAPGSSAQGAEKENADFGLRLSLLIGHLRVGQELIEANQKDDALPHFGHPIRELYGDLRPVIAARGAAQFEAELVRLESIAALNGKGAEFNAAYAAAMTKVEAALATIPSDVQQSDSYRLRLAADLASVAAQEYRNALVAGRIGSLVEYEDARGFMMQAVGAMTAPSSNPKLAQAGRIVDEIEVMIGPLAPPNPPRATAEQFEAKAAELRALLQ